MFNRRMSRTLAIASLATTLVIAAPTALAEKYEIDPTHSFIEFGIHHLGVSVLKGRFNTLKGSFDYDPANPTSAAIEVEVETSSIDTNHAERNKHLRGEKYLDTGNHPLASFKSTGFSEKGSSGVVTGELTLHGVTREITMNVEQIGAGKDPWGGYRRGFKGSTTLVRSDYGMADNLGPKSSSLELDVFIEGIRQ